MERKELPAITEQEFKDLLTSLKMLDSFENQQMSCAKCKKKVTWDNLLGYKYDGVNFLILCNNINCKENKNE